MNDSLRRWINNKVRYCINAVYRMEQGGRIYLFDGESVAMGTGISALLLSDAAMNERYAELVETNHRNTLFSLAATSHLLAKGTQSLQQFIEREDV